MGSVCNLIRFCKRLTKTPAIAGRSITRPVSFSIIEASIIEKETGLVMERPAIAGVFVRRLQKRMRLQTDPTVIYGMGKRFDGDIRRSDLKNYTPYNTYMINGLPPTPIAMPSAEASALGIAIGVGGRPLII